MGSKHILRRNFINLAGIAGVGLAVSGNPLKAVEPILAEPAYRQGF